MFHAVSFGNFPPLHLSGSISFTLASRVYRSFLFSRSCDRFGKWNHTYIYGEMFAWNIRWISVTYLLRFDSPWMTSMLVVCRNLWCSFLVLCDYYRLNYYDFQWWSIRSKWIFYFNRYNRIHSCYTFAFSVSRLSRIARSLRRKYLKQKRYKREEESEENIKVELWSFFRSFARNSPP